MDLTNPQIIMRDKEIAQLQAENARIREENEALAKNLRGKHATTGATYEHLIQERDRLREELAAAQAKIDSLMLEYCPLEMTPEQMDNWAKHQRQAKLDEALLANLKEQP